MEGESWPIRYTTEVMKLEHNKLAKSKSEIILESKWKDQIMCSGFFRMKRPAMIASTAADMNANLPGSK
jgi:hypothetical protein